MRLVSDFEDYEIIDLACGNKLERWGNILISRPDPQVIWDEQHCNLWKKVDAKYLRSNTGGGYWDIKNPKMPSEFTVRYHDLSFKLKLMGFKHTGLFPEQAVNWNLIRKVIEDSKRDVKVLNLFAYTGAASIAALKSGARVVHVDSSKGMVEWAKENVKLNHLEDRPIRFIVDDCLKFVKREIKRGNKYDIILMDPPSFGRGSKREVWQVEKDLFNLISLCEELLSDDPLLFLVNSYSTGLSKTIIEDILKLTVLKRYDGDIVACEIGLPVSNNNLILPCGMTTYWINKNLNK